MSTNNDLFLEYSGKLIAATHAKYPKTISPNAEEITDKKYSWYIEDLKDPEGFVSPDNDFDVLVETTNRLLELGFLHAPKSNETEILWNGADCITPFTMGKKTFEKLFGEIIDGPTIGEKLVEAFKSGAKTEIPKLMNSGFVELCKALSQ